MQKNVDQAEMAESEGIQAIVNHVAVQVATAVMMALRDVGQAQIQQAQGSLRDKDRPDQP